MVTVRYPLKNGAFVEITTEDLAEVDAIIEPILNFIKSESMNGKSSLFTFKEEELDTSNLELLRGRLPEVQIIREYILSKPNYEHEVSEIAETLMGASFPSYGRTQNVYVQLSIRIAEARSRIQQEKGGKFHTRDKGDGTTRKIYYFEPYETVKTEVMSAGVHIQR